MDVKAGKFSADMAWMIDDACRHILFPSRIFPQEGWNHLFWLLAKGQQPFKIRVDNAMSTRQLFQQGKPEVGRHLCIRQGTVKHPSLGRRRYCTRVPSL